MELKLKSRLPKGWEEVSRMGNDQQVTIKFGHIDPENKANPLLVSGETSGVVGGEAVSIHGIAPRGTMTKFFDSMTKMAATGWMKGYTPEKIGKIRTQFNVMQNEKYDMSPSLSVIHYEDVAMAKEMLKNQLTLRTDGFGAMKLPGGDGKTVNPFDNEYIKQFIPENKRKEISEAMKKATKEYKEKIKEEKMAFFTGSYLGYPAVFMEAENPEYTRPQEAKKRPKPKVDKNKFQGGGFDPLAGKGILPQKPKLPPQKTIKSCMAVQVGRYLIFGDLLSLMGALPEGSGFRESLTKTGTFVEKEKVEGQEYTTKHLIPVASSYAQEGYATKEDAEKILKTVIDSLTDKN